MGAARGRPRRRRAGGGSRRRGRAHDAGLTATCSGYARGADAVTLGGRPRRGVRRPSGSIRRRPHRCARLRGRARRAPPRERRLIPRDPREIARGDARGDRQRRAARPAGGRERRHAGAPRGACSLGRRRIALSGAGDVTRWPAAAARDRAEAAPTRSAAFAAAPPARRGRSRRPGRSGSRRAAPGLLGEVDRELHGGAVGAFLERHHGAPALACLAMTLAQPPARGGARTGPGGAGVRPWAMQVAFVAARRISGGCHARHVLSFGALPTVRGAGANDSDDLRRTFSALARR